MVSPAGKRVRSRLLVEIPNELSADVILPFANKQCQRYFYEIEDLHNQRISHSYHRHRDVRLQSRSLTR